MRRHSRALSAEGRHLLAWMILLGTTAFDARAAGPDVDLAALLDHAVAINSRQHDRIGTGIYLGRGLVLTASHVVGRAVFGGPNVSIAGKELPSRVVKQEPFEQSDLTLLAIDGQELPSALRAIRISLCRTPARPGERVMTVVPDAAVETEIMSPIWLPRDARKYATVIRDVASTGNSGAGVFDAQRRCLLGIISRKISQSFVRGKASSEERFEFDVAKYFVSAATIAEFLPTGVTDAEP